MKIIFDCKFQKFVKKSKDKDLVKKIKNEVDFIIKEPDKGVSLNHPFKKWKIKKHRFAHKKNELRLAYVFLAKDKKIIFLAIDSRENFYEKLKRRVKDYNHE